MPCYHPLDAWRGAVAPSTGKAKLVFQRPDGKFEAELQVPCGRCIGCRLEYSRQWAMRCMHEASLFEHNCFITLTYDEGKLPYGGSLRKADLQKFQKRLNKWCRSFVGSAPRFYQCGEYGEQFSRPHYHCLLFGFDFPDRVRYKRAGDGDDLLYTSEILTKLWPAGISTVGDLTYESAAYVARYIMKKYKGPEKEDHYTTVTQYGEVIELEPEFCTMSRRPGIGRGYYDEWSNEVYPNDEVIVRGHPVKPPRFYDTLLARDDPLMLADVKTKRLELLARLDKDLTPARLADREKVRLARVKSLARSL